MSYCLVLDILEQSRKKNRGEYNQLWNGLDWSLSDSSLSNDAYTEVLRKAGFIHKPLVSDAQQRVELVKLAAHDFSCLYRKEDIISACRKFYLKFIPASDYRGDQQLRFAIDLENFQRILPKKEYQSCFLLGLPESLAGMYSHAQKAPLVFYQVTPNLYYLVSTYDVQLSGVRRWAQLIWNNERLGGLGFLFGVYLLFTPLYAVLGRGFTLLLTLLFAIIWLVYGLHLDTAWQKVSLTGFRRLLLRFFPK
jgi:hypothetical protein